MPAWSMPGTQRVTWPHILCQRVSASSIAPVSAWPRWREPVTLGGGITMMNLWLSAVCLEAFASGVKNPSFSHQEFQADSTALGLYPAAMGFDMSFFSPSGVTTIGSTGAAGFASLALDLALPWPGSPHLGFSFTTFASFSLPPAAAGAAPLAALAVRPPWRRSMALFSSSCWIAILPRRRTAVLLTLLVVVRPAARRQGGRSRPKLERRPLSTMGARPRPRQ
mmetsp:Transcript_57524/g.168962  ORF Transcript_57524/g.168962 Transcript_57524/m.168962 type:complete len:223 (+) Transcript_57524:2855-3523(+)